eukprot:NODE_4041_length_1239_cov_457.265233_g3550_i0.p1 GENE.NODE_4041_length_1239_cov_457.265233_g3550_i0~~NODE_4041_length_1239_cov_457.265233_g3550_i0.p1  ORF type:complete len:354 (+),score=58.48 NODE_4041_length_1239_cov_457.265233_g3550_i0:85-1146(+)
MIYSPAAPTLAVAPTVVAPTVTATYAAPVVNQVYVAPSVTYVAPTYASSYTPQTPVEAELPIKGGAGPFMTRLLTNPNKVYRPSHLEATPSGRKKKYQRVYQSDTRARPLELPLVTGTRKAVIISINPERFPKAINPIPLYQWLQSKGYPKSQIVIMTNTTNRKPTKENVLQAIDWLATGTRPGDSLFFGFLGRGVTGIRDRNHDESDGYDEGLQTIDGRIILDDLLHRDLVASLPVNSQLTAILDCYHSPSDLDLPYLYNHHTGLLDHGTIGEPRANVICFSSASDADKNGIGGILTDAFLQVASTPSTLGNVISLVADTVHRAGGLRVNGQPHHANITTSHNYNLDSTYTV